MSMSIARRGLVALSLLAALALPTAVLAAAPTGTAGRTR